MTSDEDYGNLDAGLSQLLLKIQTVDSRKSYVENKTTRSVRALTAQELLCRPEGLGPKAHRLQQALNGRTNEVVVVNDEYRWIIWNRPSSIWALPDSVTG